MKLLILIPLVFGIIQLVVCTREENSEKSRTKCSQDSDCHNSLLGIYSICNSTEGLCQCHAELGAEVLEINGTCYLHKHLGSNCNNHEECDAVINGPAWCHMENETSRFCSCQSFSVWDQEQESCLPIATQGLSSPCTSDLQCSAHEALGPNSKCSKGLCECLPSGGNNRSVSLFGDKCLEERTLGDGCETDQECEAFLGRNALCGPHTQKCECLDGYYCHINYDGKRGMSAASILLMLILIMSFMVGVVVYFVITKRQERPYAFLQQDRGLL